VNENFDAKIWGIEGEFVAAPNENWLFNVMMSYNKSEVGDVASIDPRDPTNGEAGLLLLKDPVSSLNCVLDPGTSDIATVLGEMFFNLGPDSTILGFGIPIPGLASEGQFGFCPETQFVIDNFMPGAAAAGAMILEGIEADVSGNSLPNTPELQLNLGAQYTHYYASQASLAMRVDYYWQDDAYSRLFNKPIDKIDSWSIWNAQATYTPADERWYAKVYVQNILDEDHVTGMFTQDASTGLFTNVYTLEPRVYGLTLGFSF
jgi:outer membrane receptor protein involved in Fe transport